MKHVSITVTGRVQGIGFRFSSMEAAYRCGVTGFVMNRPDRSVYIEAEGAEPGIGQFVDWCRKGPLGAKVTGLEVAEGPVVGYTGFDIRR